MQSRLAGGRYILQDLTLLLAQGRHDSQHTLDKVTARARVGGSRDGGLCESAEV